MRAFHPPRCLDAKKISHSPVCDSIFPGLSGQKFDDVSSRPTKILKISAFRDFFVTEPKCQKGAKNRVKTRFLRRISILFTSVTVPPIAPSSAWKNSQTTGQERLYPGWSCGHPLWRRRSRFRQNVCSELPSASPNQMAPLRQEIPNPPTALSGAAGLCEKAPGKPNGYCVADRSFNVSELRILKRWKRENNNNSVNFEAAAIDFYHEKCYNNYVVRNRDCKYYVLC